MTTTQSEPRVWEPIYAVWRHGGWYVTNVHYPNGAIGCVSNNYPDKRWRIVAGPEEITFPTRDAAAKAECAAVVMLRRGLKKHDEECRQQLSNVLRCYERDGTPANHEERPSGKGVRVFITYVQAERIREALGKA